MSNGRLGLVGPYVLEFHPVGIPLILNNYKVKRKGRQRKHIIFILKVAIRTDTAILIALHKSDRRVKSASS